LSKCGKVFRQTTYPPFITLFCQGDLGFVVTGREECFGDAEQDDDRWRKRAEKGQADGIVSKTKGDNGERERGQEP